MCVILLGVCGVWEGEESGGELRELGVEKRESVYR